MDEYRVAHRDPQAMPTITTTHQATANTRPRRRSAAWAAYAACAWALAFAATHLYWTLGGSAGLPTGFSVVRNPTLLVIAVLAIPVCLTAALLAVALPTGWGGSRGRRWLGRAAWATCGLFLVHALPSVGDWVSLGFGRHLAELSPAARFDVLLYEPFFLLGATLFGAAAWKQRTR